VGGGANVLPSKLGSRVGFPAGLRFLP